MTSTAVHTQTSQVPSHPRFTGHEVSFQRDPASAPGRLTAAEAVWPRRIRRIVRAALNHWGRSHLAETAELLTTELVTNALQHASGPDVGFRIYIRDDRLVIEARDGSTARPELRAASPDDESGRGLLLVDAMAAAWGVSEDGTTTWCTLPLTEGTPEMEPAATTAPVLRELPLKLPADSSAVNLARLQARTLLTVLNWPGNQPAAIDVIHTLVDNAVQHGLTPGKAGQRLSGTLSVTEAHELLIDVMDPNPTFPEFDKAVAGELGRGLWAIGQLGATLSWFVMPEFDGKTVRATMRPGQVHL
ncbi:MULTISPECIES: ATP-binding protein [unclassified Streptomyces]|uniref:ATP-binding protein n=1 Tax=unclassified Streptomyces TaxID=2593676 RepID=UPI000364964F|nr:MULTISPECIES: ATP-binding protein [unclassified Streptomyces]